MSEPTKTITFTLTQTIRLENFLVRVAARAASYGLASDADYAVELFRLVSNAPIDHAEGAGQGASEHASEGG